MKIRVAASLFGSTSNPSLMRFFWLVLITYQKLRFFDRSQFTSLSSFDFGECFFGSCCSDLNEGLFCLNTFDGYGRWHDFKMGSFGNRSPRLGCVQILEEKIETLYAFERKSLMRLQTIRILYELHGETFSEIMNEFGLPMGHAARPMLPTHSKNPDQ